MYYDVGAHKQYNNIIKFIVKEIRNISLFLIKKYCIIDVLMYLYYTNEK